MASTFTRPGSPFIQLRFKGVDGKWKSKSSGLRKDKASDRRIAKNVARELSVEEHKPVTHAAFDTWVPDWIEIKYSNQKGTLRKYRHIVGIWLKYLGELGVTVPAAVTRDVFLSFTVWRQKQGVKRNTAICDSKFWAMIMEEAIRRGHCQSNPGRSLGLKMSEQKHKSVWTDDQIKTALDAASSLEKYGWLHVALLMGRHQATRLGQTEVPLNSIDVDHGLIHYPGSVMKGGKPFDQMIDPDFNPILREIIFHRRQKKESTLATLPKLPSIEIRQFLDRLGFAEISHHGLRATWITQAAMKNVPETFAKRFVNHASTEIHAIYQRIGATDLGMIFDLLKKS